MNIKRKHTRMLAKVVPAMDCALGCPVRAMLERQIAALNTTLARQRKGRKRD